MSVSEMLYRVKPIEFECDFDRDDSACYTASTIFCPLRIYHDKDDDSWQFNWCVDEYYDEGKESVDSKDEGIARANQWYRDRLAAALEPVDEAAEIVRLRKVAEAVK
jgi:hypothetical protein